MTLQDIEKEIEKLPLSDCYTLAKCIRKRVGVVAQQPDKHIKDHCFIGTTASVIYQGKLVTGTIIEITGHCVVLQFASEETMAVPMAKLHPAGFKRSVTDLPARKVNPSIKLVDDYKETEENINVVLYNNKLYIAETIGDLATEARRVFVSQIPESLPTKDLIKLIPENEQSKKTYLCL